MKQGLLGLCWEAFHLPTSLIDEFEFRRRVPHNEQSGVRNDFRNEQETRYTWGGRGQPSRSGEVHLLYKPGMDAATQSIEFALASNAVIYIVPRIGDNLGVGIETGSVLEAIFRECDERTPTSAHQERVLFIHESGVRSAMIAAVQDRWDARIYSYDDRDDLVHQLRLFVRDLARREQHGDLPQLD
jgi:hypothetical protein